MTTTDIPSDLLSQLKPSELALLNCLVRNESSFSRARDLLSAVPVMLVLRLSHLADQLALRPDRTEDAQFLHALLRTPDLLNQDGTLLNLRSLVLNYRTVSLLAPLVKDMLTRQAEVNALVHPQWAEQRFGWHRAIYVEAVEFLEHLAQWKWWKKPKAPDFAQAQMELVDIWHFALSLWLSHPGGLNRLDSLATSLASQLETGWTEAAASRENLTIERVHDWVDRFIAAAGAGHFNILSFCYLCAAVDLSPLRLYRLYVGKYVLNRFRQLNGYQTGAYRKIWDGREDNEHLVELLDDFPTDEYLPDRLWQALFNRYMETA